MARNVYFAFDYDDVMEVNIIRKADTLVRSCAHNSFRDWASHEEVKRATDQNIRAWISDQMNGSSVTVVCIGEQTANSKWVIHELEQSVARGNGILGISMQGMARVRQQPGAASILFPALIGHCPNPMDKVLVAANNGRLTIPGGILNFNAVLSQHRQSYTWEPYGRANIATWIEAAAKQVGK